MSGFVLDTPEQINAWVLLSRYSQVKMQMKGLKTPGLVKWLNTHGVSDRKRVGNDMLIDILDYMGENLGYEHSDTNYQVYRHLAGNQYLDCGIYSSLDAVEDRFLDDQQNGAKFIINRTLEEATH